MLGRLKEELAKSRASLAGLQAPESGIKVLLGEVQLERDHLVKAIEALETTGQGEAISTRVAALDDAKKDAEQRIARLEGSFAVLDAVRRDLLEFKKRQEDLAVAFAKVETDPDGKSLTDRLEELDRFSAEARGRLRALQEILTTLNRYRRDLAHSQAELSPMLAPGEGIHALIGELNATRAELQAALDDVEISGNEKLGSRVESIADSKRTAERRIAEVHQHFAQLASIRSEIASAFADLNSTLSKFG